MLRRVAGHLVPDQTLSSPAAPAPCSATSSAISALAGAAVALGAAALFKEKGSPPVEIDTSTADTKYLVADKIGAGALPGGAKINVTAIRPVAGAEPPNPAPLVLITAPHIMAHLDRFVPLIKEFGCTVEIADVEERMEAEDLLDWAGKLKPRAMTA